MEIKIFPVSTLKFPNNSKSTYISIKNDSINRIAFVIKTTEPNSYVVKPNIGVVEKFSEVINLVQKEKESKPAKFKIEIYNFHWKPRNKEDVRGYLLDSKMTPILTKVLETEGLDLGEEYENKLENNIVGYKKNFLEKMKKSKNIFQNFEERIEEKYDLLLFLIIFLTFIYLQFKMLNS